MVDLPPFGDLRLRRYEVWLPHGQGRPGSPRQAARRFGVTPATYRALEAGERWPAWETYDGIAETFGWPRSFR
jgi:hypothetical protein